MGLLFERVGEAVARQIRVGDLLREQVPCDGLVGDSSPWEARPVLRTAAELIKGLAAALNVSIKRESHSWGLRHPAAAIYDPARASFTIRRASSTMRSRWPWSLKLSA